MSHKGGRGEMAASVNMSVVVVGGGIAGLTAAIALTQAGARVQIVEKASALTQAGTALSPTLESANPPA